MIPCNFFGIASGTFLSTTNAFPTTRTFHASLCRQCRASDGSCRAPRCGECSMMATHRPQPLRYLHATPAGQAPRKRNFFSSNAVLQEELSGKLEPGNDVLQPQKRKPIRSPPGKTSLRRVAVEAQRSRESALRRQDTVTNSEGINRVTAISVADQFDMDAVVRILRSHGFSIDPDETGFDSDQVIHTRGVNNGDIFVFPSGSLVAWSLPQDVVSDLATKTLLPAAVRPHMDQMEMEDLEYAEDPKRESSNIKGDVITLGTKSSLQDGENTKYVKPIPIKRFADHVLVLESTRLLPRLPSLLVSHDLRSSLCWKRC